MGASDDPQRQSLFESARSIADTIKKDFKPYAPALLLTVAKGLKQTPVEYTGEDSLEEDMSLATVGNTLMGLKTSATEEMENAIELAESLIDALEEDFCDFLADFCPMLRPTL